MNLRASQELTGNSEQGQAPAPVAAGQLAPSAASRGASGFDVEDLLTMPVLAAASATLVLGAGWMLRRRRQLARRPRRPAGAVRSQLGPVEPSPSPAPAGEAAAAAREAKIMADFASQFEDEPSVSVLPQQTFPAQLGHQHRPPSRISVASQKRLVKCLMWVRAVAGAVALAAAIAVAVFGAIELTDLRSGDTGLTKPLMVLLAVTWAASWGAGRLANLLHRAFFGRVHPKFDT